MKLTKVEKTYIDARRSLDSPKQIAKDLHLLIADVEKYIAKLYKEDVEKATCYIENSQTKEQAPPVPSPEPTLISPKVKDMMVTKTAEKKSSGVMIMTQVASELADETKSKGKSKTRYGKESIFVIDPNKKD